MFWYIPHEMFWHEMFWWIAMISSSSPKMKLASFLRFAVFKLKPMDLSCSSWQCSCCSFYHQDNPVCDTFSQISSACWGPVGSASGSDGVHTNAYDRNSDEVVSDENRNPAYTSRSGTHSEKQSIFTSTSNLSHLAPKVRKSASITSLTEEGLRANKTLLLGQRIKFHLFN